MLDRTSRLAAKVITRSDHAHPADAVLREQLRHEPGLARTESQQVRNAVFAYYRWLGWLTEQPLPQRIHRALELDDDFKHAPESFRTEDMLQRAVPPWTSGTMSVTAEWVRTLQREPVLWLRARRGEAAAVAAGLGDCLPGNFADAPDALEYRGTQDLFMTPEFHAGRFEIQDVNSQRVGVMCDPKPGETWWDACAGEGGKTLHLSGLMGNKGLIWATDRVEWRLQRLKRRTARADVFNYRAAAWDGGARLPTRTKFDGVLVDAPCSGMGTWQRNPHARWTTSAGDVTELASVQAGLLKRVASAVKPAGRLVYAVCTLTEQETMGVVREFSAAAPEFELEGEPRTLRPQQTRGNGMFVAIWRRIRPAAS